MLFSARNVLLATAVATEYQLPGPMLVGARNYHIEEIEEPPASASTPSASSTRSIDGGKIMGRIISPSSAVPGSPSGRLLGKGSSSTRPLNFFSHRAGAIGRVHTFLLERYGLDSGVTTTGKHHAIFNRDVVGLNASSESVLYWSLLLYLGTVVVLCILYFSSNQTADDVDFLPRDGFSDELQDCCTHPNICIASFCCPFARWADTVSQAQLLQFNVALSLWILAGLIDLAWLFPAGVCLVIVVGAYNRMELRATFKLPKSRLTDVLAWVLCMPCAIAQEARHAERARSIQEAVEVGPRAYFQGTVARKPSDSPKRQ